MVHSLAIDWFISNSVLRTAQYGFRTSTMSAAHAILDIAFTCLNDIASKLTLDVWLLSLSLQFPAPYIVFEAEYLWNSWVRKDGLKRVLI